ncbi:hypothetical protein [Candidatus Poriferisocius sp.]|uniref:hypothetical protein n=1 Tax=Candidatus Poriferisocius sp. TaxID=3101276 RepID=UPI003B52F487
MADQLDEHPDRFEMSLADASIRLGVSPNGGKGALRALYRLERYRLAARGHDLWAVRRAVPVLSRQRLIRLPHDLRASHSRDARAAAAVWDEQAADRAAQIALAMAAEGMPQEAMARRLEMMRVPPAACAEASKMAVETMAGPQAELDQPHARREAEAPARGRGPGDGQHGGILMARPLMAGPTSLVVRPSSEGRPAILAGMWALKGGQGTSTTAALAAVGVSVDRPALLVDLCGDQAGPFRVDRRREGIEK